MVIYPHGVHPLFVGTASSIKALDAAMGDDKQILLVAKRRPDSDATAADDLFDTGTLATVLQLLKLPDGTVKVLVEGGTRARVIRFGFTGPYVTGEVESADEPVVDAAEAEKLVRSIMMQFEQYIETSKKIPQEVLTSLSGIDDPARLIDTIAAQMNLKLEEKQQVLEAVALDARLDILLGFMQSEIDVTQLDKRIRGRVKQQMEKSQREYYLNEQMKAIQKELGDLQEAPNELDEMARKIDEAGMPEEARTKAQAELNKLKLMPPMSAEATVVRSYVDWITSVPWKKKSRVRKDLAHAQRILDEDHYGLEEVKDRITEYLAVQTRVKQMRGPVLCLVGPPGVGKTSLGESIARATNRKFVRMALGGVRDEAEIRGHRRTYIGSMPGKILQKLAKCGVSNPLFLLDEIDKMGMDVRGDPASALLEVLDPEQNSTFNDHYLEVDYDLSDVFFICTSNSMNIPGPLLDRMEVIRLPGYTEDEKLHIADKYLLPKQQRLNGLGAKELQLSHESIIHLIRYYTREAGVRGLEREIAKIARKVVKRQALMTPDTGHQPLVVTPDLIEDLSGVRKFNYGLAEKENQVGIVTGLAWTQVGGELLSLEAVAVPGKGRITKTGSLGDVMQESIQAAITFVRSRSRVLGIPGDFHEKNDLHIHVPEGATPKDGPSAGIGMCTALVSVITGIPVRADVAMTGEITLRGQVLPIGGLKEKLLAARRAGIKKVIIPAENERDLKEIPETITGPLEIVPVQWMDQVLDLALERRPQPLPEDVAVPGETPKEQVAGGDAARGNLNPH
ncbi:MAG: endopeptidase La [Pseudomonadales bacterium]|nr:endopeptidase La [Pseudomonadales bacterium]MCP5183985.1 endopeptidase La [Pseudomonadales bacterium]